MENCSAKIAMPQEHHQISTASSSDPPQGEHGEINHPHDDPFEDDSAIGSDIESLTQTLNSEVLDFEYSNGRRYNAFKNGTYLLPNDEVEVERLDIQHKMWTLILSGKLYLAPLNEDEIHDVVDIATGTGNWAIDFADAHPQARVIECQILIARQVPQNLEFIVEDSEMDWMFTRPFDFIHSRAVAAGWKDWPNYFRQAFNHLKPGGWIEIQDLYFMSDASETCDDGTVKNDHPLVRLSRYMIEGGLKMGFDMRKVQYAASMLKDAGFVDIHQVNLKFPWTEWPEQEPLKTVGRLMTKNMVETGGLSAVGLGILTKKLGWSREKAELFLMEGRNALKDTTQHCYSPVIVVYARKPSETGSPGA
ncbi:MAG: hypothetical protein M1834_004036 [Cirrosporium novae-zelandiae]|nr:MAG: hypothetical protein M1834_004036 [Cirrosporium novae-zelandiae]